MPEESQSPNTTNANTTGSTAVADKPATDNAESNTSQSGDFSSASVNLASPEQGGAANAQAKVDDYQPQTPPPEDMGGDDQSSKMQQQAPPPPPPAEMVNEMPPEQPKSRKPLIIGLALVLLLLLIGGAVWWWLGQETEPEPVELSVDQLTTENRTPTIAGSVSGHDEDEVVTAEIDGVEYETITMNESWEAGVTEELEPGTYDVTVSAYNTAGEREETTAGSAVTIEETVEPLEADVDPVTTEDSMPTISGNVSDPERTDEVSVLIGGQQLQPEIDQDGSWEVDVTEELEPGGYDVIVSILDTDGESHDISVSDVVIIEEVEEPEEEEPEETPSTGPSDEDEGEEPEALPETGPSDS